jgi:lipopolysaccharide/colanic/teichoic acid biosynthesis glycosyltransferase
MVSLVGLATVLLLFHINGLYDVDQILEGSREYARVAHATTYGLVLVLAATFLAGSSQWVSRSWLLLTWAFCILCVSLGRFAARRVVRSLREHGLLHTRVVIVGASTLGVAIAEQLRAATHAGLDLVGFLDEFLPIGEPVLDSLSVVGRPSDLVRNYESDLADEYILVPQALPHERQEEIAQLMVSGARPLLRMAVSSTDLLTHGVRLSQRGCVALMTVQPARLDGFGAIWKRSFDLIGAVLGLTGVGVLVVVALARGWLGGRRGLLRRCEIATARGSVQVWLLEGQMARSPLVRGAPALLAVLVGQLSLVGPRPARCGPLAAPAGLTALKPGLTGPWRLSGPTASLEEQAIQDLSYVRNYSIWEDVRIMWESLRRLSDRHLNEPLGRWEAD